jgi:ribokinase
MIVVFGSINVDLVVPVKRLPRPGETVLGPSYALVAGGKGANQALAAARTGAPTRMVGAVGHDQFAEVALAEMAVAGVDLSGLRRCTAPTGCAVICVDEAGENQIAVASGANLEARESDVRGEFLAHRSLVAMQMEVPLAQNWALASRAKAAGARLLLNVAPAGPVPISILPAFDWLVVNEVEANAVAANLGLQLDSSQAAGAALHRATKTAVVVTLGSEGAIAFADGDAWEIGTIPITPLDTTGAGDAFVGAFAAALDEGADLPNALRWGSVAGALACLVRGAQPSLPTRKLVEQKLGQLPAARRLGKPKF